MKVRYRYMILSFLATAALVTIGYLFIDKPVAFFCRNMYQPVIDVFQWITMLGISTGYLFGFFMLFLFFKFYKRRQSCANRALFLFSAIALSGIVANIIKNIVARY